MGNVYAPHAELADAHPGMLERFYATVESHLTNLPPNVDTVLGGDFNATVGTRQTRSDSPYLGPHGIGKTNAGGEHVLNLAHTCELRVSATYFQARRYHTFLDHRTNTRRQLDLILVSQRIARRVTKAGVYQPCGGIISDHTPTRLYLRLTRPLQKRRPAACNLATSVEKPQPDHIDWSLLHRNPEWLAAFQSLIETVLYEYVNEELETATPTQLSDAIMYAAEHTVSESRDVETNWFDASEAVVRPLRDAARLAWQ